VSLPVNGEDGAGSFRIGQGYDIHRLVVGRPLVLAGVTLPWDLGLEGHSDGDAVCHALADALLGASGMGDIGHHFPSDDPKWKDAASIKLLGAVAMMLDEAGYTVQNVDLTIILEVPRIGPYREEMIGKVAEALRVPPGQVGLKAKSNDRLGPVGSGEAIAVLAVALVHKRS
jgi:2-C-methyl-D-erythritol 2,4-cyclodiphosphate synthase